MVKRMVHLVMFFALYITTAIAQDPYLQRLDEETEGVSVALAKAYTEEVPMNGEQAVLFQKKIAEFLIRKRKIEALDIPVRERLRLLRKLSRQESAEMATILDRRQARIYRKIKKRLQPIMTVVDTVE